MRLKSIERFIKKLFFKSETNGASNMAKAKKQPTNNNRQQNQAGALKVHGFRPLTTNQDISHQNIKNGFDTFILGSAGTGKTFLAINAAMELVDEGEVRRVIIVRSTVPSRDQGFLPGTADEKAAIYERPYNQIFSDIYGRGDAYGILKSKGIVKFESTSYLRGMTFDDAIIIIDEAQNLTWEEFNTVYTRLGDNSRVIVCGDIAQTDKAVGKTGLNKVVEIGKNINGFSFIWMSEDDIVRSGRVKQWIIQSNRYTEKG